MILRTYIITSFIDVVPDCIFLDYSIHMLNTNTILVGIWTKQKFMIWTRIRREIYESANIYFSISSFSRVLKNINLKHEFKILHWLYDF